MHDIHESCFIANLSDMSYENKENTHMAKFNLKYKKCPPKQTNK